MTENHDSHQHGSCSCNSAVLSVHQSMQEMDFEKGIWSAAVYGDYEKVKSFLEKGTPPSIRDISGYTALHYASRNNHLKICELLLDSGADPNAQTLGGTTPLHRAAYKGNKEIAHLLLHFGADPMLCDSDGKTAVDKATESNQECIKEILCQAAKFKK